MSRQSSMLISCLYVDKTESWVTVELLLNNVSDGLDMAGNKKAKKKKVSLFVAVRDSSRGNWKFYYPSLTKNKKQNKNQTKNKETNLTCERAALLTPTQGKIRSRQPDTAT